MLLALSVALIIFAKFYNGKRFVSFLWLPFNNRYIALFNKKGKLINSFHVLFLIFQLINISIFLSLCILQFNLLTDPPTYLAALISVGFYFLYVNKVLVQISVGYAFNFFSTILDLIYNKQSYFNHSSFIFFAANICALYIFPQTNWVFYVAFFLFILINSIGVINVLRYYQKPFTRQIIYFILYLCALEIAPLVIFGSYW